MNKPSNRVKVSFVDLSTELARFHEFVGSFVQGQDPNIVPEESLLFWREANPLDDYDRILADPRESVDAVKNGEEGILMEQFEAEFRRRYSIPPSP